MKNVDGSLYTNATNPNGILTNSATSELFATTPAGIALRQALTTAGVKFPTTPYGSTTAGTRDTAARMLQYQPLRPVNTTRKGDPSYSLSTAFQLTKKIDLKAAWSRSFSLPDLENGVAGGIISGTSNFTIVEYTDTEQASNNQANGQITVANPGILPEVSSNWDFEASYYTDHGGKFTLSYYTKEVTNQIQNYTTYQAFDPVTFNAVASALGLNPDDYDGWRLVTSTNSATVQKTDGWEAEVRQDLGFLGAWGPPCVGFLDLFLA